MVLLDEPTASLDPDSADRIRAYLSRYQETTAATILLASHEVERLCSDVVIMRAGTIVDCDAPGKLIERLWSQDHGGSIFGHRTRPWVKRCPVDKSQLMRVHFSASLPISSSADPKR